MKDAAEKIATLTSEAITKKKVETIKAELLESAGKLQSTHLLKHAISVEYRGWELTLPAPTIDDSSRIPGGHQKSGRVAGWQGQTP